MLQPSQLWYVLTFSAKFFYFFDLLDSKKVFAFGRPNSDMFRRSRQKSGMFRMRTTYVSTFSVKIENWVSSDFVLHLKLLFDREVSVEKLHLLHFQSPNNMLNASTRINFSIGTEEDFL